MCPATSLNKQSITQPSHHTIMYSVYSVCMRGVQKTLKSPLPETSQQKILPYNSSETILFLDLIIVRQKQGSKSSNAENESSRE